MASCKIYRNGGLAMSGHAAVHLPERSCVLTFGGRPYRTGDKMKVDALSTDTYEWRDISGESQQIPDVDSPSDRSNLTAVKHQEKIYIFGKEKADKIPDNIIWYFDIDKKQWSWSPVRGDVPKGRFRHSACVINGCMIVFGGLSCDSPIPNPNNDLRLLNLSTYEWTSAKPHTPPVVPVRFGHTASVIGEQMYVIGGVDGEKAIQTEFVQVYDFHSDQWHTRNASGDVPAPRSEHCAVTRGDEIFIFGGLTDSGLCNDLHSFHMDNNQWSQIIIAGPLPPPLDGHQCVAVGARIIIIGGSVSFSKEFSDLAVLEIGDSTENQKSKSIKYAENVQKLCGDKSYSMRGIPKGAVLIINMNEVKQRETGKILSRSGAKEDRKCMKSLFTDLSYVVEEYEDVNRQQLTSAMQSFVEKAEEMRAKSIFVVLMSHGGIRQDRPYIFTYDGDKMDVRGTIEHYFSSSQAPRLAMIPKIVIVQSCQGGKVDEGLEVECHLEIEADSSHAPPAVKCMRVAEFFNYYYGFATQPMRPAWREPRKGSWFIAEINKVFRKKAATKHLSELMAEVRLNVSTKYGHQEGFIQTPEGIDGLNRPFFLFPGIE